MDLNWWDATDGQIIDCLRTHGPMKLDALCDELRISEGEASTLLAMLTNDGRVRIREVELVA
jgi:predicted ArsR family transcriptional regulator